MDIFSKGWKAGVEDAKIDGIAAMQRDARNGNAGKVVENAMEKAGAAIQQGANRLGAGFCRAAGKFFGIVGADNVAKKCQNEDHRLKGVEYMNRAEGGFKRAGVHFKRAWTAASRAYEDKNIEGIGANLAFSVASWGANMKEGLGSIGCAIGDGFKSLKEQIQSQI